MIDAGVVVPDVDLVAGSPRNGIPGDDRQLRLVAGCAVVGIGTRVARVAHVQVLDPRLVQERVVGERLFERRSLVPVSGVAVGVDRSYAPVVGVVRESLLGGEGRRDRPVGRVAADLGVSLGEIGDRVDLDLVLRCTGDRIPRELRNEQLGFGCGVLNVGCRRRRPLPGEGAGLGRLALVPLRVDGGDGPVVRVRGKEERRRSVRRLGLERITVASHEGGEVRIGGNGDVVLRRAGDRRPPEHERLVGEGDRRGVVGGGEDRRVRPELFDLTGLRPAGGVAVGVDRLHAPVVRAVRNRLVGSRPRVLRPVDLVDGRVEGRVRREDEVVLVGARDRVPGEDREEGDGVPVVRPDEIRYIRRARGGGNGD